MHQPTNSTIPQPPLAYCASSYQISTKPGTARLNYWWFSKFSLLWIFRLGAWSWLLTFRPCTIVLYRGQLSSYTQQLPHPYISLLSVEGYVSAVTWSNSVNTKFQRKQTSMHITRKRRYYLQSWKFTGIIVYCTRTENAQNLASFGRKSDQSGRFVSSTARLSLRMRMCTVNWIHFLYVTDFT